MCYVQDRTPHCYVSMPFPSSPQDEWVREDTAWPSSREGLPLHTLQTHPPLPRIGEGVTCSVASSFSGSVVMCDLSLQLSEYGAYDFANNASKVSITFLPPCLPPCHPPPPFSSSHSSSFSASFSTATVDHTTATVAVKCMNFKFWPVTFSARIFDQSRCLVCFTMKFQESYLPRNVSYYHWINECWVQYLEMFCMCTFYSRYT